MAFHDSYEDNKVECAACDKDLADGVGIHLTPVAVARQGDEPWDTIYTVSIDKNDAYLCVECAEEGMQEVLDQKA